MGTELLKLPQELQLRVKAELKPGEVVNWAGQPLPRRYAANSGWMSLFFIPWTAFAIFWICGAANYRLPSLAHPQDFFALLGLPFVVIGVLGLGTPFWLRRAAARVVYVVTNQRAFSVEMEWRTLVIRSYLPEQLSSMKRDEHSDGSGNLWLALEPYKASRRGAVRNRARGFVGVADVKRVGWLLEDLASRRSPRA